MTLSTIAATLLVCLPSHGLPTQQQDVHAGLAKYYSSSYGDLSRIAAKRGVTLCAGCQGFASRPECGVNDSNMGRIFYASVNGHVLRLVQVDCAMPRDLKKQLRDGLVVELSWTLAVATGLSRRGVMPASTWEYQWAVTAIAR